MATFCQTLPDYSIMLQWPEVGWELQFVRTERTLVMHVLARTPQLLENPPHHIDVHALGLDAGAHGLYHMSEVSGVAFAVQAVLLSQRLTPEIMNEAMQVIEMNGLEAFSFLCAHATHRSRGCALLLETFLYPRARITFSTDRTRRAAVARDMVPCTD